MPMFRPQRPPPRAVLLLEGIRQEQAAMHCDLREFIHHVHNELRNIMSSLDALTAEVADSTTITASVLALVQSLADQITAAGTDPVALRALVDQLHANDAALAAAVQANTPAPPDPNA